MRHLAVLAAIALTLGCMGSENQQTTTTTVGQGAGGDGVIRDPCWDMAEKDGYDAYRCYRKAILTEGEEICGSKVEADAVFYCQAAAADDPILCQGINDELVKINCVIGLAQAFWNTSICEQMLISPEMANHRFRCIMEVAKSRGDASVCESISQATQRDRCVKEIAEAADDARLCATIHKDYIRESCILNVATATGNKTLCAELTAKLQRELCEDYVKRGS